MFLSNILSNEMEEQSNPQNWFCTDYQCMIRAFQDSLPGSLRPDKQAYGDKIAIQKWNESTVTLFSLTILITGAVKEIIPGTFEEWNKAFALIGSQILLILILLRFKEYWEHNWSPLGNKRIRQIITKWTAKEKKHLTNNNTNQHLDQNEVFTN